MVTTMLAPHDLQDWQEQNLQGTTSNHFGVQGPSLPGLREGSLYVSVYKLYVFMLLFYDFRLVMKF